MKPTDHTEGMTRRGFLLGTGAGLAAGFGAGWFGLRELPVLYRETEALLAPRRSQEINNPSWAMPGPFPGRVIEVHHAGAVTDDNQIQREPVAVMMAQGMCALTGADHPQEAWKRFFEKGDVVGIKVNPVGRKPKKGEPGLVPNAVGSISSPEVLVEIVLGLLSAGVRRQDIIVFERYADQFRTAGYEDVVDELGVRWFACAAHYSDNQVDIEGYDGKRDRDPHVVGYDPDVFVHMGFAAPTHDPKDDRRFRSHLSAIVTRMVNKIVTIPVLKDHRSAGVTLALKNMSHGMNNNVARSHLLMHRGNRPTGPNQCNTFIPTAVAQPLLRQKATLHIMDGLIGVYEGGPGCWNRTWSTWRRKSLFFATDPVALDMVGWDIIDAQRHQQGWPAVGRMGALTLTPAVRASSALASLGGQHPSEAMVLTAAAKNREEGRATEVFECRQPEHVILAGTIGLGVYEPHKIDYRCLNL